MALPTYGRSQGTRAACRRGACVCPALLATAGWLFRYERELKAAIGVTTTNAANPKADFEKAMAHFEPIAGDAIVWQLRLYSGDARRILHEIRDLCRNYGSLFAKISGCLSCPPLSSRPLLTWRSSNVCTPS